MRVPGEPETLDWNRAHTSVETYLLMNLMEGLVSVDSDLKILPGLAQSWSVSPDGKIYTFHLRPGVKWSDGVPLRARDFVYSWRRLLSPLTAASYAYFLFDIEGAAEFNQGKITDFDLVGIKAPDELTIQVKLRQPIAHWLYVPSFWVTFPLRQDIVEKYGSAWDSPGRMVTVGPFTLASHDADSKVVLRSNPFYYGKKGNIDQVVALIIKDDSTAMNLYESGKMDFLVDIPVLDLKRLAGRSDIKIFPYFKTMYMAFVVSKFPVNNVKLRRAIAMAIDKSQLPRILHGGQAAASSFVPPKILGYSANAGLPFDPVAARAEMRNAGFNYASPPKIELLATNWDKTLTLAQYIQQQLKTNLGIDVIIQSYDHKTFRAQVDLHANAIYLTSWAADYPDPDNFLSVFLGNSGNNRTQWKNARYDQVLLRARNVTDRKVREMDYLSAQKILLNEDTIAVPLFYEPNTALIKPRVHGLELNPMNYLFLKNVNLD